MSAPMVFIAGPFTSDPQANTRRAIEVATCMLDGGLVPIVPHLTLWWDEQTPRHYETWLTYDLHVLARCDYLYRMPGESAGADGEVAFAHANWIPVWDETCGDLTAFIEAFR